MMTTSDGAGTLIKLGLKAVGLTQISLAERVGVTQKHVSGLIQGHVPLTPRVAVAIGRQIGIDARVLLMADVELQVRLALAERPS